MNREDAENTEVAEGRAELVGPDASFVSERPASQLDPRLNALSSAVIGAAIEVHSVLGPGFMEGVYEEALCLELDLRHVTYRRQAPVVVQYRGRVVGKGKLDLIVGEQLVVELKAVDELAPIHTAQLLSYLRATNCLLGLLLNFNAWPLKNGIRRVINGRPG